MVVDDKGKGGRLYWGEINWGIERSDDINIDDVKILPLRIAVVLLRKREEWLGKCAILCIRIWIEIYLVAMDYSLTLQRYNVRSD